MTIIKSTKVDELMRFSSSTAEVMRKFLFFGSNKEEKKRLSLMIF